MIPLTILIQSTLPFLDYYIIHKHIYNLTVFLSHTRTELYQEIDHTGNVKLSGTHNIKCLMCMQRTHKTHRSKNMGMCEGTSTGMM